jgi:para-aminobenzoate synthetase/4-amino-4-deoxychorismate lyase
LAELATRPLRSKLAVGPMLRALAAGEFDTATMVCLAGRWAGDSTVIGWQPSRVIVDENYPEPAPTEGGDAFGGGWIGCLDYDGGSWFGHFEQVLRRAPDGSWWLEALGSPSGLAETAMIIEAFADSSGAEFGIEDVRGTSPERHLAAVEQAISAIRAGELFQVNICARFHARLIGSALDLFAHGLATLAPDYAAYLHHAGRTIVSFSPELFLQRTGRQLRSAPIKGTRRRTGDQPTEPAAQELLHSTKDRAENVMIVDLMRNDLARVCTPGSVRVTRLLNLRPAPGVWHLVSEVTGTLRSEAGDAELLLAGFPPGSVTGAPKVRALALIDELETDRRGLFTGAIGYASPIGDRSEFSVAIRTFEITGDRLQLGVGGGITADSTPMAEWQECLIKAAPLFALGGFRLAEDTAPCPAQVDPELGLYETMLAVDGRIVALADHLARLDSSCQQVFGMPLPAALPARLRAAATGGRQRIRVTVRPDGSEPVIDVTPAGHPVQRVQLRTERGRTGNWRHKWADRRWLAALESDDQLPLFVNAEEDIAETSRGNLAIVSAPGVLRTPVLSDDLLPGITRRRLLDVAGDHGWRVELGRVGITDCRAALLVLNLSSISGAVAVERLDGHPLSLDLGLLEQIRDWLDVG